MAQKGPENISSDFDQIIAKVGNNGYFQIRFILAFNFLLIIFICYTHMNKIVSLNVPEHWCHVPGRENTNYSIPEWKSITIPKEINVYGVLDYSKCMRFTNIHGIPTTKDAMSNSSNIIKCDRGWEYENTWYKMSAPMQYGWVCEQSMIPTNALALGRAGEVVGAFMFGQLSDNFGRRPVFFAAVAIIILGRVLSIFTAPWVYWFLFFSFVSCLPGAAVFQSPMIISIEISRRDNRSTVNTMMGLGWSLGIITIPFFMWWLGDWLTFSLVTTLPCILYFFSWPWTIESPRWLASHGKIQKCMKQLKKISKTNKTQFPENMNIELTKLYQKLGKTKIYTILELFSSPRLAKNTIIMVYCVSTSLIMYISLLISVNNLSENSFLNYFYQSLAEVPSFIISKYASDKFGRRPITFFGYFFVSVASLLSIFAVTTPSWFWSLKIITIFARCSVLLTYYNLNLQSVEIYPTCIRQSGLSLNAIFGNVCTIFGPYVVALGLSVNASIPYIIYGTVSLIAAIGSVFLPETKNQEIPETLNDASTFGAEQDFWGRDKQLRNSISHEIEIPLNMNIN